MMKVGKSGGLADFVQAISHREDWSSRIEKSEDMVAGSVRVVGSHGSKRGAILQSAHVGPTAGAAIDALVP